LVDKNHSAAVDVIQLAQIIWLVAELSKPVEKRHLPDNILQGLEDLLSVNKKDQTINTLDNYLGFSLGTSSGATLQSVNTNLSLGGNNGQFESVDAGIEPDYVAGINVGEHDNSDDSKNETVGERFGKPRPQKKSKSNKLSAVRKQCRL
jgi:hypothetical protein